MKKLGFGTMRLPLLDGNDKKSIDFDQVSRMTDLFLEKGFTYFDTAYPYHEQTSEIAVRECLVKRHPRDSYLLADKMPIIRVRKPEDYPMYFEEQLQKCGVDYFDYYLLHNIGVDRYDRTKATGGFEFLAEQKKKGTIRKAGFSFHDRPALLEDVLKNYGDIIDFVQLQINYLDWDSSVVASGRNYELCVQYGKPVVVMEPIKGGILADPIPSVKAVFDRANNGLSYASWAVRYVAGKDNILTVLSGMSSLAQMEDNLSYMRDFQPLSEQEEEVIRQAQDALNAD